LKPQCPGLPPSGSELPRSELQIRDRTALASASTPVTQKSLSNDLHSLCRSSHSAKATAPWTADALRCISQVLVVCTFAPLGAPGHSYSRPEVQVQVSTQGWGPGAENEAGHGTKPQSRQQRWTGHSGFGAGSHQEIYPRKFDSDTAKGSRPFLPTLLLQHLHPRLWGFCSPLQLWVVFTAHGKNVFPRR